MVIGNKKEIKLNLYQEMSVGIEGGGGLEINWNPGGMSDAAAQYAKAKENYLAALADITAALGDMDGAWEGSASAQWKAETNQLLTKLNKIGETLTANSTNLGKISGKFTEIESTMKTKVSNIVGS